MRNQPSYLHEVYNFEGTPYEVGYQRGKQTSQWLKPRIERLTFGDPYDDSANPPPVNYNLSYFKEKYPSQYSEWQKAFDKTPEWFKEEAHGNADGAGVPYEKLITMWFPFRMGKITTDKDKLLRDPPGRMVDECNGFVAFGKATVDGKPLIGGNGETDHASIKRMGIIRVKNKKWNSFVMQTKVPETPAGQCGINDKGVAIFGSGVHITPEEFGVLGFREEVRRRVLQEANNLDEAIDIIKEGPRMGGQHIYVTDPKRAVHIEYTGHHIEVIDPEECFDAGASAVFSSPKMQDYHFYAVEKQHPLIWEGSYSMKRGMWRMQRYHELFAELKPLKLEIIPRILGDHGGRGSGSVREDMEGVCPQGSDFTICVHGSRMKSGSFHASSFSNISVPEQKKMYVAFGNPCECGYVPFYPP